MFNREMKYIVFDTSLYETVIIFDEAMTHDEMAGRFNWKVISAGFIKWNMTGMCCYGKSIGLDVKSRPEDAELVNRLIGGPENDDS